MSVTAKAIFEDHIPSRIGSNPDVAKAIDAAYTFHVDGDGGGVWTVDLRKADGWVTSGVIDDAGCVIHVAAEDFVGLATGTIPGPQLFMMGKLRIEGDMGLAMKLGQVLGTS